MGRKRRNLHFADTTSFVHAGARAVRSGAYAASKTYKASKTLPGRVREASFPFISGDTFRASADVILDKGASGTFRTPAIEQARAPIVFAEIGQIELNAANGVFLDWLRELTAKFPQLKLVVHNGDIPPSDELFAQIHETVGEIYCVNAQDGIPGVTPLPLGLENMTLKRYGYIDDYLLLFDGRRDPLSNLANQHKESMFHCSFALRTNRPARTLAAQIARATRGIENRSLTPARNRQALMSSKFVICPPGNGPDTHRVWESIYLGAVPVILRGTIAHSVVKNLPVWEVDDWHEALESSDDHLNSTFVSLTRKGTKEAMFCHWWQKILGSH